MAEIYLQTKGTLREWQETVVRLAHNNSRLTTVLCFGLMALLREGAGLPARTLCLVGGSPEERALARVLCAGVSTGTVKDKSLGSAAESGSFEDYIKSLYGIGQDLETCARKHELTVLCLGEGNGESCEEDLHLYAILNRCRTSCLTGRSGYLLQEEEADCPADITAQVIEVPADAGAGCGLFEDLHGAGSREAFCRTAGEAAKACCGQAAAAYLGGFVRDPSLYKVLQMYRRPIQAFYTPKGIRPDGQMMQTISFFSLLAAAGKLAEDMGILTCENLPSMNIVCAVAKMLDDHLTAMAHFNAYQS